MPLLDPVQAPKGTFGVEGIYTENALASGSEEAAVAEYVHWHRHKKPFGKDTKEMNAKNHEASRRVQQGHSVTTRCYALAKAQ